MKTPLSIILATATLNLLIMGCLLGCSSKDSAHQTVDVSKQIAALKSADNNIRVDAAIKLAGAGRNAASAVPALIETLKDKEPEVRRLAAYALGEIGPKANQAIAPLKELLRDENREVVTQVVNSLRNIDPKSINEKNVNVVN